VRTSPTSSRAATKAVAARDGLRVAPAGRRSLPWVLAGLLLVVVCALAFAVTSSRLGQRQAVLAIAHAVPAGHLVDHSDLAVVRVSVDPGLRPIAASAQATVVGRPAAVPLLPGTLLTEAALGAPSALRTGEAVVGLALKPGQFPPGLAAGARVLAAETGPDADTAVAATGSSPRTYRAVVVGSNSYGKGTVQRVIALPNNGEMSVTWARFHAPSGYTLHELGVLPSICTSEAAANADKLLRLLQQGRIAALPTAARNATNPDDTAALNKLRANCPSQHGESAIDLEVAAQLLESPSLYNRAIDLAHVSGPANENLSVVMSAPEPAPLP